jgi:hypothetical protein
MLVIFCYDQIENAMEKMYKFAATEEQKNKEPVNATAR